MTIRETDESTKNRKQSVILCGSRKYEYANLDDLVDSFSFIVRHNSLTNSHGYGKRPADMQVLNVHMYSHWTGNNISLHRNFKRYEEYGQTMEDHVKYLAYIKEVKSIVNFKGNGLSYLNKMGFDMKRKQPRCGMASIAYFISKGVVPFVIGYSIDEQSSKTHVINSFDKGRVSKYHNIDNEVVILKKMHNMGLVDASFCTIKDAEGSLSLSDDLIVCTKSAKDILKDLNR